MISFVLSKELAHHKLNSTSITAYKGFIKRGSMVLLRKDTNGFGFQNPNVLWQTLQCGIVGACAKLQRGLFFFPFWYLDSFCTLYFVSLRNLAF